MALRLLERFVYAGRLPGGVKGRRVGGGCEGVGSRQCWLVGILAVAQAEGALLHGKMSSCCPFRCGGSSVGSICNGPANDPDRVRSGSASHPGQAGWRRARNSQWMLSAARRPWLMASARISPPIRSPTA